MKNLNKDLCGFLIQYFQATILGSIYRMIFMYTTCKQIICKIYPWFKTVKIRFASTVYLLRKLIKFSVI